MRLLTLLAVVAALCIACDRGGSSGSGRLACTNNATGTAVVATVYASADDSAASREFPDDEAHCLLRRALVVPADLPPGWEKGGLLSGGRVTRDERLSCQVQIPRATAGLRSDYKKGESAYLLQEVLALQPGQAEAFMQGMRHSCAVLAADNEAKYKPVAIPALGDESVAYRDLTYIPGSGGRPLDDGGIAYIRNRDLIAVVSLVNGGDLELADVARMAAEKLATVDAIPEPTPEADALCSTKTAPNDPKLEAGLVTIDDMPAGWIADARPPCDAQGDDNCSGPRRLAEDKGRGLRAVYVGTGCPRTNDSALRRR